MAITSEAEAAAKQVEAELTRLTDAVSQHDSFLSQLEQGLSDVLIGEVPQEGKTPEAPEEALCALAGKIRSIRRGVQNQSDQVKSILRRLEL